MRFKYKGIRRGKQEVAEIEAVDRDDALRILKNNGIKVQGIKTVETNDTIDDAETRTAVSPTQSTSKAVPQPEAVAVARTNTLQLRKALIGGGILAALIVLVIVVVVVWPRGPVPDQGDQIVENGNDGTDSTKGRDKNGSNAAVIPMPRFDTGVCRIYTSEPGFRVLVDGDLARDADGKDLLTPCSVIVAAGTRTFTIVKEGFKDSSQEIEATDETEVEFDTSSRVLSGVSEILAAPFFGLAVGEPVPLTSLNTARAELDPYISPDGLSLLFVSDRIGAKGIYVATRTSVYHDFREPEILVWTSDLSATPSITADSLFIIYAVPEKARLMAATRENPFVAFANKKPIRYSQKETAIWQSAQMLADGLRIYWVENDEGNVRTLASSRKSVDVEFKNTLNVIIPGVHPCMSSDGLRQYSFDGTKLARARRISVTTGFGALEHLADLEIEGYVRYLERRQYSISNDQQWLFFCPDPKASPDLYMVRVSNGASWGVAPRGKSIPPKKTLVASTDKNSNTSVKKKKDSEPIVPQPKAVDPRTIPLPYTSYSRVYKKLLAERSYEDANSMLRSALSSSDLAKSKNLLNWDLQEIARINEFWKDIKRAAESLKEGDQIRLGKTKVTFLSFKDGVIVAKGKTKQLERPIKKLDVITLAMLLDRIVEKDDPAGQLRFATFLFYESNAKGRAKTRFARSGDDGLVFYRRQAQRILQQAQFEMDRDNTAAGMQFIRQVMTEYSDSPVAKEAAALKETLYSKTKWRSVGRRKWSRNGIEWSANTTPQAGSALLSPEQYTNFELKLEWKTTAVTGQGGVFFRYPGTGEFYATSFKIQLSNDFGISRETHGTGSLFAIEAPSANAVRKQGEWNTLVIRVQAEKVEVSINNRQVLKTSAINAEIPIKGFVALDGVAGGITYRKILLTELLDPIN